MTAHHLHHFILTTTTRDQRRWTLLGVPAFAIASLAAMAALDCIGKAILYG